MINKIILASASPRRKELIKLISDNVVIRPADCDETLPEGVSPKEAVEYLSKIKNEAARKISGEGELIISADTVVAINNKILGKPHSKDEAREMITLLSGNTHSVFTGVTISRGKKSLTFSEETKVEFYPLTKDEIERYISTNEPYDKAGGYGIQGKGGLLVKKIDGDYSNVVGLPVARLNKEMDIFFL